MNARCQLTIRILIFACLSLNTARIIAAQDHSAELGVAANSKLEFPAPIRSAELGDTVNVHSSGTLYFAGQFTETDIAVLKAAGVKRVITLRTDGEIDWDEEAALKAADIEYVAIPFRTPESLTDGVFDSVRMLLAEQGSTTLFHCGSANRVGAAWLPYRVLDEGVPLETAVAEAEVIGLRTEEYLDKARRYIRKKQANRQPRKTGTQQIDDSEDSDDSAGGDSEMSIKPARPPVTTTPGAAPKPESVNKGVNADYTDPDLDVDEFIKRFEIESREVYSAREAVVAACKIKPGSRIADVGAGTGLYTRLFAESVGLDGWVYAIDIAPRFIEHINGTAKEAGLGNVTGIINSQSSIHLPPESVDLIFICDTYHHFENPEEILTTIHSALKPDGQLVLIDFDRIPGTSTEWIVSHVRAGKEVFRSEIELAGFELVEQVAIDGFMENYFLRFRKK